MLKRITNLFTQSIPMNRNSSMERVPRYTSEQGNSYESTVSVSLLSDKKIQNIEALNHELHCAITNDSGTEKLLLEYKANRDGHYKYLKSTNTYTNLTKAVMQNKYDIVNLLLKKGANPNFQVPSCFYTALAQAAMKNNKEIAELLIEYDAKIEWSSSQSTLYWCEMDNNADNSVMRLLLEKGADPAYGDRYSQPCFKAIGYDNAEALSLLFSYDTKDTFKNMIDQMMAKIANHSSINCMQLLLDKGYNINSYYLNDENILMTPLMMALYKKEQYLESRINFIIFLLKNGANIVYEKEQCNQPCFRAIRANNCRSIIIIIKQWWC